MIHKQRLDILLVERQVFSSRERAQSAIVQGKVLVNGLKIDKPGTLISRDASVEHIGKDEKYVSRGGYKLEKALNIFKINAQDRIALDCGASTGGFTDCLLQHGAQFVYAVDVGYGQIDYTLRMHPKVKIIERLNLRYASQEAIYGSEQSSLADLAVIDLSFISLLQVLKSIRNLMQKNTTDIIALIKPQFEAGKEQVPKKGVIKDPDLHKTILKNLMVQVQQYGMYPRDLTFSPLKGATGNIEYLVHLVDYQVNIMDNIIMDLVQEAFIELNKK